MMMTMNDDDYKKQKKQNDDGVVVFFFIVDGVCLCMRAPVLTDKIEMLFQLYYDW
jgi:hypothetical protein